MVILPIFIILMIVWTFGEWLAGQRWIEIGEDPTYEYAHPLLQFGMLMYDIVIEMGLFMLCFLAIPSLLKLIKRED